MYAKAWRTEDQSAENYCTASGRVEFRLTYGLTCTFNYLFSTSSRSDEQQLQAFENTWLLVASFYMHFKLRRGDRKQVKQ